MLSWSDRQASVVTVSGWFDTRIVLRDLPPNMREMDVTELAYSCPSINNIRSGEKRLVMINTPCNLALSPQSDPLLRVPLRLEQRPARAC